jgi:RHS repeat-associated protein
MQVRQSLITCRNRNQCELRTAQYNEQIKTTRQINEWRTTNISANQRDDIGYDEFGQRLYMVYGDGVKTNYTYDPYRRWLSNIKTAYGTKVFQDMDYTFDEVGNILKTQNKGYKQTTQNYRYDDLYQLVHADGNYTNTLDPYKRTTSYTQDFTYDDIGNMTVKTSTRQVKPVNTNKTLLNYKYDYTYDNNSPHRATVIGDWKYTYDDNGNVTNIGTNSDPNNGETGGQLSGGNYGETHGLLSDPDTNNGETHGLLSNPADTGSNGSTSNCTTDRDDQYIWNEENRLVQTKISGESTFYVYNAGGERTIKCSVPQIPCHRPLRSSYMTASIQYYYHADHLGSTSFVTCWDGRNNTAVEYEHYEYAPYGETWVEEHTDTFNYINFKFTSKELDEETGLYDFGQRYLDPQVSRWMSPDPIYDGLKDGLSIYGYCNNPIVYHDPNGLLTKTPITNGDFNQLEIERKQALYAKYLKQQEIIQQKIDRSPWTISLNYKGKADDDTGNKITWGYKSDDTPNEEHNGQDFVKKDDKGNNVSHNQPFKFMKNGKIIWVNKTDRENAAGLNVLVANDDGTISQYDHFESIPGSLKAGDKITIEMIAGYCGHTGHAYGDHVHVDTSKSGTGGLRIKWTINGPLINYIHN